MAENRTCMVFPVCLRPNPISPENACFGVILRCDAVGYSGYKLAQGDEKVISRIVDFFPGYGRAKLEQAMVWASHDIEYAFRAEKNSAGAFVNLVRPRENVIRYGAGRSVTTSDPAGELERQYNALVSG